MSAGSIACPGATRYPVRSVGVELVDAIDRHLVEADHRQAAIGPNRAAADGLDDRVGGGAGLDLDHQPARAGEPIEHLGQRGHAQVASGVREPRVVGSREARAGIGLADLAHRQFGDRAGSIGRPVECVVVDDRQLAVGREVDVELDRIGPRLDAQAERLHRVLRRRRRGAAVSDDERHRIASPGATIAGSMGAATSRSSVGAWPGGTPITNATPTTRSTKRLAIAIW